MTNYNSMEYKETLPSDDISSFVKCFWQYRNDGDDITHTIFPNGHFELFMIFYKQDLVAVFMSGLRTQPFEVLVPRDVTVLSVRFKLLAAEYVFNLKISSILDTVEYLDLNYWNLKENVRHTFEEFTIVLEDKIRGLIKSKAVDPDKSLLLDTVYNPNLTVKEISETVSSDRRKINRYFNNQFGISLKTFLNIIRLRAAFEAIKSGSLFPEEGYFDQSHYIKECKKYTGKTPGQLYKNDDDRFLQFLLKREP